MTLIHTESEELDAPLGPTFFTRMRWNKKKIAAMSDDELRNFINICEEELTLCVATNSKKMLLRYRFLLDTLAYPERDCRQARLATERKP